MDLGAPVLLSVALAMDASAVALARGMAAPRLRWHHVARVALLFGGFQALMPLLGWALARAAGPVIGGFQHWIAAGLLVALGGKMVVEGWRPGEPDELPGADQLFGFGPLVVLAIATSIDALAAGATLPGLGVPLPVALIAIGSVTALLSGAAVLVGRALGRHVHLRLEVFGGLILVGLGVKTLVEHLA